MSSKRSVSALAVYSAKRRKRSISNPHPQAIPPSSPLKTLDSEADGDLSIAEMSRRMLKRSRSSLKRALPCSERTKAFSVGTSPADGPLEGARPAKKTRTSVRPPLATIAEPAQTEQNMTTDMNANAYMDLTDIAQVKTPAPQANTLAPTAADSADKGEGTDFLSPLPTYHNAKRVIAHRRSSQSLKENQPSNKKSTTPSDMDVDLASPFHSRPTSPKSSRSLIKNMKTLNRTRSVGTDLRRRATMRSFSRAQSPTSNTSTPASRHPSLPGSQSKSKEKQEWFVPAQLKKPVNKKMHRSNTDTEMPFVRESSFFDGVPVACSTPIAKNRVLMPPPTPGPADLEATPRLPLFLRNRSNTPTRTDLPLLDEPTPRAQPGLNTLLSASTHDGSLFSDVIQTKASENIPPVSMKDGEQQGPRMAIHLSKDSIFSSALDFSATYAPRENNDSTTDSSASGKLLSDSVIFAPPTSPTASPASRTSSDGDELRDMFSIMGLDGLCSLSFWFHP